MSSIKESSLGLNYGWSYGETGWNSGMDENIVLTGFHANKQIKGILSTPPTTGVNNGDAYIVGSSPTGAWVGNYAKVAIYDRSSWLFATPSTGVSVYNRANGCWYEYNNGWSLKPEAEESPYIKVKDFDFSTGYTITDSRQLLFYPTTQTYYQWNGAFPKVVSAGSTPTTSGGIGAGAWVDRTDVTLRDQIDGFWFIDSAADVVSLNLHAGDKVWIDDRRASFVVKTGTPNGLDKIDAGGGLIAELYASSQLDVVNFGADPSGVVESADAIIGAIYYAKQRDLTLTADGVFKTNKTVVLSSTDRIKKLRLIGNLTVFPTSDFIGISLGSYVEWQSIKVLADNITSNAAISSNDMYRCNGGSMIVDVMGGSEAACTGWAGGNIFLNTIDYIYIARVRQPVRIQLEFNANTIGNMEWHACKTEKGVLGNIKASRIDVFTIEDCGGNGGWITGSNFAASIGTLYLEKNPSEVVVIESGLAHGFPNNNGAGLSIDAIFSQDTGKTTPIARIRRHLDVNIGSATISGTSGDWLVVEDSPEVTGKLGCFNSGHGNPTMSIGRKSFFRVDRSNPTEQIIPDNRLGRSNPHALTGNGQKVRSVTYDQQAECVEVRVVGEKLADGTLHNGHLIAVVDTVGNAGVMVLSSSDASTGSNQGWVVEIDKPTKTVTVKNKTAMSQTQSANLFITCVYKKYNQQA